MPEAEPQTPILVNSSSTPAQVQAAVGQIAPVIGGAIVAFGLMSPSKATALIGVLPIAANLMWRMFIAWQNHEKLKIAAHAAPDSVAQVVTGRQELR